MKATKLPLLREYNKEKHTRWENKYMKTNFSIEIFSDKCKASVGIIQPFLPGF